MVCFLIVKNWLIALLKQFPIPEFGTILISLSFNISLLISFGNIWFVVIKNNFFLISFNFGDCICLLSVKTLCQISVNGIPEELIWELK